ncbi:hypothetical protein JL720_14739 [Aureococcus anophagefferens]|nr:hypothetical protein JL720_14739 [Aureococcus anophagefferens]
MSTAAGAGAKRKTSGEAAAVVPKKRRGGKCSSKYIGVVWDQGAWKASYRDKNGKLVHIGNFESEDAAARAYNAKIAEVGLKKRPTNPEIDGKLVPKPDMSSEYCGVSWDTFVSSWKAQVNLSKACGLDGKMQYLGRYANERSAALAVDAYLRVAMPSVAAAKSNFPTMKELTKLRLNTPMHVILTRDFNGKRHTIRGCLTTTKYDPSAKKFRAVWQSPSVSVREHTKTLFYRYRVSFKHRKAEAAALGLKKRLWDTLIGDDSAFVRWDMSSKEPKKKKAKKKTVVPRGAVVTPAKQKTLLTRELLEKYARDLRVRNIKKKSFDRRLRGLRADASSLSFEVYGC